VARLKPRVNEAVNRWWICDAGRYGFGFVDDDTRLTRPTRGPAAEDVSWEEAVAALARLLREGPGTLGVIASPRMANEDLFALRRLLDRAGVRDRAFRVPTAIPGDEDDFLIRADKNPNTLGAALMGLDGDTAALLAGAREGRLQHLWVFGHDLFDTAWPVAEVERALAALDTLIFTGTNANRTSARAHLVLPAAAWVEREGTFTNFQGRVQRFRAALEPLGEARPEWQIAGDVLTALGEEPGATRAAHWFRQLAAAVAPFRALRYESLGAGGAMVEASGASA
jgi:NADH-quinone oxidoreductase subunit G